ncbi:alpha-2-macroglobulin-like protein 1 isoform X2 [Rana temporaria]|uniref:alpha-2-macroglobulin-like protein 1 isoform X2 n=1 Tax=Rana temporaria TaxID=8407 RepID=UPI001AACBFB8|nr:alpha-2-macroglobulin-like protein 1 isoform X2 [Rana temporaria]
MSLWTYCVGLILLQIYSVQTELHHVVIFPSELRSQHYESICIQLEGAGNASNIKIFLSQEAKSTTLINKRLKQDSISTCIPVLIPDPSHGNEEIAKLQVSIFIITEMHINMSMWNMVVSSSTNVIVKKESFKTIVQTDKAVYKPGQTVNFRVFSLNEDLLPGQDLIQSVHLQDSGKNRIGQWLNVTVNQGFAEFSFPLSSEPLLGKYSIWVNETVHHFSVEEYVLPKYEVTFQFPKAVLFNCENIPVTLCSRYTYGKPVLGDYRIEICRRRIRHRFEWYDIHEPFYICANYTGKLDPSGCTTVQIKSETFYLTRSDMNLNLEGSAYITEQGTGIELSASSQTRISNVINKVKFAEYERTYKPGMPYCGLLAVTDFFGDPLAGHTLHLSVSNKNFANKQTLVTNEKGRVSFVIENTSSWTGQAKLVARTTLANQQNVPKFITPDYGYAELYLNSVYSRSKSLLKIHSLDVVLPCEGQHEVKVDYIIKRTELEHKVEHMDLLYMVTSKGSIQKSGLLPIPISEGSEDLRGETTVKLSLTPGTSPLLHVFVHILLPNGKLVGDSSVFKIQRCFKNKVSVGFSPGEVLPGSDVSLQVQAAPGSLCGLRAVDKSVVLMDPKAELTNEKIYNLFPHSDDYDWRIQGDGNCYFIKESAVRTKRSLDVYSLLKEMKLKIFTSAEIKTPEECILLIMTAVDFDLESVRPVLRQGEHPSSPVENKEPRIYFPETWIWQLVAAGDAGTAEFHHKAPDTITDWNAGAVCLGPGGFGLSPPASLRVYKPFFVDLTLPYSVVRGEKFTLKATVFNYLKQSIMVQTTLLPSIELDVEQCDECQYSSCLSADESKTFYWILKASKLGNVPITVRTEAVKSSELCQNEIPFVPTQGSSDTIIKPLLVQPGGVLQEKSYSSLFCSQGNPKTENIFLQIPVNTLKDSERADVTVRGDLMGSALENLDRLLAMPNGCGEQNMMRFAPNIFILHYLEKTHQLTDEIESKAIRFLNSGYQRELTFKRNDGSYSAFGSNDPLGNTWLTAFVVKSFSNARRYIFIDEGHLNESFSWLREHRKESGCFRNVGKLFHTGLKGGVEDDISLSAYVAISLMESGVSVEDPLIRDAVSCLQKEAVNVTSMYTLALLAYTFTLCGEMESRKIVFDKLYEKAVRGEGQLHWEHKSTPSSDAPYWHRAASLEVEIGAYVLLALLSQPNPDLDKANEIVNWLCKHQNPYGGFSSTQDTVVALQALAKYADATYIFEGDTTLTVTSKTGFLEKFHVNNENRLLVQRRKLPTIPGDYTVTATGSCCVFVQTVLRFNIPVVRNEATFAVSVEVTPKECVQDPVKKLGLLITAQYTGARKTSNMAIIEVKMLSGYIPVKSSLREMEKKHGIQRSEVNNDLVTLYLNEIGHDSVLINIQIEQDIEVKGLKPGTVRVYDYYETDEEAFAEYNSPCSSDIKGNAR